MNARLSIIILALVATLTPLGAYARQPGRGPHVIYAHRPAPLNDVNLLLARYGTWIYTPVYGWLWQPNCANRSWRPYGHRHGRWARTPYGRTWISTYAWGEYPYQNGEWVKLGRQGWFWRPDPVFAARVLAAVPPRAAPPRPLQVRSYGVFLVLR